MYIGGTTLQLNEELKPASTSTSRGQPSSWRRDRHSYHFILLAESRNPSIFVDFPHKPFLLLREGRVRHRLSRVSDVQMVHVGVSVFAFLLRNSRLCRRRESFLLTELAHQCRRHCLVQTFRRPDCPGAPVYRLPSTRPQQTAVIASDLPP